MAESIVFVHGASPAAGSWERFAAFFAERGYATLTPEWPRDGRDPVGHHAAIAGALGEPILIGHAYGGLIVQVLLGDGLGRAAVALAPAQAPAGAARPDVDREDRGPLLFVAGEHDRTVPPALAKASFDEYRRSAATTEFVEFPGRSHLLMAGEGWDEVAQYVADWLDRVLRPEVVS